MRDVYNASIHCHCMIALAIIRLCLDAIFRPILPFHLRAKCTTTVDVTMHTLFKAKLIFLVINKKRILLALGTYSNNEKLQ